MAGSLAIEIVAGLRPDKIDSQGLPTLYKFQIGVEPIVFLAPVVWARCYGLAGRQTSRRKIDKFIEDIRSSVTSRRA